MKKRRNINLARVEKEVIVNAPVEKVFSYISEPGTGEYTQVIPNHWIIIETKGGVSSTITWTFRSVQDGTRVNLTVEYRVPIPLLGKLAEAIIVMMNEQEGDLMMANLRARFMMS